MKKKLIICVILLLILVPIINNFYPRNVGKLIQAENLSENTTKVIITKYDGIHEKGRILITDKSKIQELINYLSKEKARKYSSWGTYGIKVDKHYNLEFYGNRIKNIDIYDSIFNNNYLNIGPKRYKFTSNFNPDYINNLHD